MSALINGNLPVWELIGIFLSIEQNNYANSKYKKA